MKTNSRPGRLSASRTSRSWKPASCSDLAISVLSRKLAGSERSAGAITDVVRDEFRISQPAVSQHLGVLRTSGFVHVRVDRPAGSTRTGSVADSSVDEAVQAHEAQRAGALAADRVDLGG
jgi:DNA-binding transcriptional ArsR family regulator